MFFCSRVKSRCIDHEKYTDRIKNLCIKIAPIYGSFHNPEIFILKKVLLMITTDIFQKSINFCPILLYISQLIFIHLLLGLVHMKIVDNFISVIPP